ncbi:MAG: transglycosylase SLT domain-containing protein [Candidatus Shapirobacteria bacterium]
MPKKLCYFLFSFFLVAVYQLSFIPNLFAASSPGLNLINQPGSIGYISDSGLKNWLLIVPENPSNLSSYSASAPNIVVRIHAWWTASGKAMLGAPGEQAPVATAWCNVLNNFSSGKTVYVEPFNELEQNIERASPQGELELLPAIARAKSFINLLQACPNKNFTVISPGLDPQNANFATTSNAFSDFSIISYHPYRLDTATNYSSGVLTGKQFIFTETGTIVNGKVVYDDCEFIKYYCGQKVTEIWSQRSDILAYFLFSFQPDGGPWRFTNLKVAAALQNKCTGISADNCSDSCELENTTNFPGVTISGDYSRNPPTTSAASNEYQYKDIVPNDISQSATVTCQTNVDISESKNPTSDGQGGWLETTVDHVIQQVLSMDGKATNPFNRENHVFWAKKLQNPLNSTPEEIKQKFTSFGSDGWNASIRSTPFAEIVERKKARLKGAVLNRSGKNSTTVDEQVAWGCGGRCYSVNCKIPFPNCRPVYLSEVASFFKIADSPEVAQSIAGLTPLSSECYQKIYNYMEITDSGSYETNKVIVKSDNGNREKTQAYPWAASVLNNQGLKLLPQSQQTVSPNDICNTSSGQSTQDEPSPLTLTDLLKAVSIIIRNPQTLTATLQKDIVFDENYVKSVQIEEKAKQSLLPAQSQIPLTASSNESKYNRIDPGFKAAENSKLQAAYFLPASWQTVSAGQNGQGQDVRAPYTLPYVGSGSVTPEFCSYIFRYAPQAGLDPYLIAGLISVESSFNPSAISSAGAVGLMQVMPRDGLAAILYPGVFDDRPTVAELLQPEFNVSYGTRLLANLKDYYGSLRDGLKHYGPTGMGYDYPDRYVLPAAEKFRNDPTFCQSSVTPTP